MIYKLLDRFLIIITLFIVCFSFYKWTVIQITNKNKYEIKTVKLIEKVSTYPDQEYWNYSIDWVIVNDLCRTFNTWRIWTWWVTNALLEYNIYDKNVYCTF